VRILRVADVDRSLPWWSQLCFAEKFRHQIEQGLHVLPAVEHAAGPGRARRLPVDPGQPHWPCPRHGAARSPGDQECIVGDVPIQAMPPFWPSDHAGVVARFRLW